MPDFPTVLSEVVDDIDDVMAKHINNLEAKVGIDSSSVNTTIDYKLSALLAGQKAVDVGDVKMISGRTAKAGWLLCNGVAVSRSTYSALFAELAPTIGTFTVSIATPAIVTLNTHGFNTGDAVFLTTTGALPTGLTANTIYYVVYIDANTFNLATTLANALAGTKIATSGSQSGTHTLNYCPYGLGDGSTTFNVPNIKGKSVFGLDTSDNNFKNLNAPLDYKGEKTHLLTSGESGLPAHTHPSTGMFIQINAGTAISVKGAGADTYYAPATAANTAADASSAHNNLPPHIVLNFVIKT